MHPKLLLDVIERQAGSLDKAILEGGMNGIEAINALEMNGGVCKDKNIYITYDIPHDIREKWVITIQDFGKGLTTKEEIENFFETFGTPHDESEHKIYAQFRMGRGQMFSFGKNIWRTGTFELTVDILNDGLDWKLKENLPFVDGCHITIELYEKTKQYWPANTVDCLKEAVKKQMEFVDMPIMFNGEQINTPPADCQWDMEDEFAYYNFNIGDKLHLFNLGVFVQEKWGTNGIVVAKKQLKVNFARNDVMSDCPVFFHINEVVKKHLVFKSKKRYVSLSQSERRAILKNVRDGQQNYSDIKGSRILQTAQDKYISCLMFLKNSQPWTIGRVGSRQADKCIQQGTHTVFAREMLEAMNYSGEDKNFLGWLLKTAIDNIDEDDFGDYYSGYDYDLSNAKDKILAKCNAFEPFEDAVQNISNTYTIVAHNKLTKIEKRLLTVLDSFDCWEKRELRIGISESAAAWTNGSTNINLDRAWLKNLNFYFDGDVAHMFSVLAHELAHDNDTSHSDIHAEDFYERYHDITGRRGHFNPFTHCLKFSAMMKMAMRNEQNAADRKKKKEALAEKAKKLGIGSKAEEAIVA